MSRKPEGVYIRAVHKLLPPEIYSMKNHNPFIGGVPDCWYSARRDMWVEYKWLPHEPKRAYKPDLTKLQQQWLRARHEEGRAVVVIVGCPTGGQILLDLEWEHECSPAFNATKRDIAEWISKELLNVKTTHARRRGKSDNPRA
ncbi:MAG: hypothetical protein LBV29_03125 [Azoarcus sp.]|jgi:hypothetical protein|nr:hypothetical protein [Azoarcus sp.]